MEKFLATGMIRKWAVPKGHENGPRGGPLFLAFRLLMKTGLNIVSQINDVGNEHQGRNGSCK